MRLFSVAKDVTSSQSGRIDQAFWTTWANMASGKSFEDSLSLLALEPAAKAVVIEQLKKALSNGRKPKFEDLPSAYKPISSHSKTAMISDAWGNAVKAAKTYWAECLSKKIEITRKSLKAWLEEKGFDPQTAQDASETVSKYFASIHQYDRPTDILESSNKGMVKTSGEEYDFSCTMAFFPKDLAEKTIRIALDISDASLYDPKDEDHKYGREVEPHITVKFGTHTDNPEDIKSALKGVGPIRARLGRISLFDTNKKYDVIKVDVLSEDLEKANKLISDKCKNTDSYPKYIPHATIAYVEKGTCEYLKGNKDLDGIEVVFDELSFHDKVGNKTIISLKEEEKVEKKASTIHPLDEKKDTEWFGMKLEAGNYHQKTRRELNNILEEVWRVSEKDFKRVDSMVSVVDKVCRNQRAEEIIESSKSSGERPRLCAERIYCTLKDEIKEEQ